jgi:flagellar hook-associated protein 3 FlgL
MRVTFNLIRDGLAAIHDAADSYAEAQNQVSSGKRVQVPSDDPTSAQQAVTEQAELGAIDAYTRVADSASARITALDSTLGDIITQIIQATTAATSAHGTTATQTSRDAAAGTLQGVRDAILGDINTTFGGTYLFGGSKVTTRPYAGGPGAWAYGGDAASVSVNVDRTRSVTIAMDGQSILKGTDASDVLSVLDGLIAAVQAGDNTAIGTGIDALGRAFNRVAAAQSHVGLDENSLSDGEERLAVLRLASATRLSKDQDANMADALTKMSQAQTVYQAALGAVGNASKLSLLDYLT